LSYFYVIIDNDKGDYVTTKKLKGKVSVRSRYNGVSISVKDDTSVTTFLEIEMDPVSWSSCLGGQSSIPAILEINNLDRVGLKRISDMLVFEIEDKIYSDDEIEMEAMKHIPEGWDSTFNFGSQDSRFHEEGKKYAKTAIHKRVESGQIDQTIEDCPNCGPQVALHEDPRGHYVGCGDCGFRSRYTLSEENAIESWSELLKKVSE